MIRQAAGALLAPVFAGCANYCSDGMSGSGIQIGPVSMSQAHYHPCNDGCLDPVDPKPCGCSRACPCWTKHE